LKREQDRTVIAIELLSDIVYVFYRTVPFPMTLSDREIFQHPESSPEQLSRKMLHV